MVIRRLVTQALEQDPALEVVGAASNGAIALQRIPQLNPDVLTLDIEMPEMDGLEMLRRVRREYPQLRVIMFSTLTERGAAVTLEALTLGADDYVAKASNEGSLDRSMMRLREEMIPKIKQFFRQPLEERAAAAPDAAARSRRSFEPGKSTLAEARYGAARGGRDRSVHGRADRARRDLAQHTSRLSVAHPDCAAYAASLHAAACRASQLHVPAASPRSVSGMRG